MMRQITLLIVLAFMTTATSFAADKNNAFLIKKRDFKKTYKVIALTPVDADAYLEMPDSVAAILEQEVTARLQKRGYTVIPSSVLADIRSTMEAQVGGTTDPETGNINTAKARAVRDHAFRELWFQHTFDAIAIIRISVTQVPMESDRVQWDGAKQKLAYEGRSQKYSAKVAVSSVSVGIYDAANSPST